jgi:signal transduction histidine kinase
MLARVTLGLRARILLVLAVVLAATVGLARLVVGPVVRTALVSDLQVATRARAEVVADLASLTMADTEPFADPVRTGTLETLVERIGRLLRGTSLHVIAPGLKIVATSAGPDRVGGFLADDPWLLANLTPASAERLAGDHLEALVPVPVRAAPGATPSAAAPRIWVLASASLADIAAVTARVETLVLIYMVGAAVLLLLTGWALLTRRILRPVSALAAAVDRVTRGDLRPVAVAGGDEIARLGSAFNQMLAELEARRAEAIRSEKLAVVGRLAAGVAHEVGNPLQAMLGYAEILIDDVASEAAAAAGLPARPPLPADQRLDMLRRVHREIERVKGIVGDLVAYARPVHHEIVDVPLGELLTNAVVLLKPQPRFRNVHVRHAPPPDLPVVARAAPGPLTQVVVNLLLNAADAIGARAPGAEGAIQIGVAHRPAVPGAPAEVELYVEDDGVGISPTDRAHLFDPFFTTKEPGQGTGLGLAVSQRIVEGFRGRIEVESDLGRGAKFRVVLPSS